MNYVANTVEGFVAAAECDAALGQAINFGSGREISIGDLACLIADLVGTPITIECEDERLRPAQSEVDRLLADNSLARRLLAWEPKVSLEDGLQETIAWIRRQPQKSRPDVYTV